MATTGAGPGGGGATGPPKGAGAKAICGATLFKALRPSAGPAF